MENVQEAFKNGKKTQGGNNEQFLPSASKGKGKREAAQKKIQGRVLGVKSSAFFQREEYLLSTSHNFKT